MSDDAFLGVALGFVPRRIFVTLVALAALCWGWFGILSGLLGGQLPGEQGKASWHSADRCVGRECNDLLSCSGAREASFHCREATLLLGSALFGYWGLIGCLHCDAQDLAWFAMFLWFIPVFLLLLAVCDGVYVAGCSAYPLNVVDEGLLWGLPDWPIREAAKAELRNAMVAYPIGFVDKLVGFNTFMLYAATQASLAAASVYCSFQVLTLARISGRGLLGLGANFDIGDWRERAALLKPDSAGLP